MPINPLIALGVRTPNAVPLVENFTRGIHHRRQQGIQNDLAAKREGRAQQVHDFNVDEARRQIAAQGKEASVADYAQDMLRLQGALSDGNNEEAGRMLNSRVARLDAIASQNPGANINSNDTRELLQMLAQDPSRLAATVNREVKTLERLGTLKAAPAAKDPVVKEFKEGDNTVTKQLNRSTGQWEVVSTAPTHKSDVLSDGAMAQRQQLEAWKAKNDPTRALTRQIAAANLERINLANKKEQQAITLAEKKAAAEELAAASKQKDIDDFTGETLDIVKRLLTPEGKAAVESAAGPIDSKTYTLIPETADAQIDLGRLRARLTKDNLKLLTGVISDNDIRFLEKISAGGLDLSGSDEAVIADLERIQSNLVAATRAGAATDDSAGADLSNLSDDDLARLRQQKQQEQPQ